MAVTKTQKYIFRDEEIPDLDQEQGNPPRKSILGKNSIMLLNGFCVDYTE